MPRKARMPRWIWPNRRAGPGCDYDCEVRENLKSEENGMAIRKVREIREIKNIAFPVRRPGIWSRIANYIANFIKF